MSISMKIIIRLAVTTLIATVVAYGWLYVKAARVHDYLDQRALVQQARDISDFISVKLQRAKMGELLADGEVRPSRPRKKRRRGHLRHRLKLRCIAAAKIAGATSNRTADESQRYEGI